MNYERIYNQIIQKANSEIRIRTKEHYYEKHHIIPKCLGGNNDSDNLVMLTAKEHFICHRLLCEIYPGNKQLIYALWCMVTSKGRAGKRYIPSSRIYELIKTQQSSIRSELFTGKKMSAECIAKRKKSRTNWKHTDATKLKISNANSGKVRSQEFKDNLSNMHKGRKAWNAGKKTPDDIKQRISETMKRVRQEQKQNLK
jgi:hypothetical protein